MPGPVFIRGDDEVALRTVEEEDLEFFQRNWNDPRVRRLLRGPTPENMHATREAFEDWMSDNDDGSSLLVCDESGEEPEPVGNASLFRIDEQSGHGYLACWIDPDVQGEGYATTATRLVVDYAFRERRLHKVIAEAFAPNAASRRVLEKVGLREEGRLRDEKFVDGEYVDVYRFGMLESEWEERT